ncbi:hypothetical protein [Neobacillus mesonae]|uniref:Phage protein n=1 Tax=Neobacillus mesonae TaxID=1193713 RepID=A0A3T0HVE1_9BACI|nr:hypothetical protein [Neobacillus mesonae]AZU61046.1 hypothetical protein CHR53_07150 [Neobacillus mesonae]
MNASINGKVIRVAGNDYTVDVNSQVNAINGQWGNCSYGDNRIQIAEGLCENRQHDVLVHEMMHAVMYEAGYDDHEEELVNRVSKVLYQVLRDNDFAFMREEGESDESPLNKALEALY